MNIINSHTKILSITIVLIDDIFIYLWIQPNITYNEIANPTTIIDPIINLVFNFYILYFLCNSYAEFKNTYELLSNSSD